MLILVPSLCSDGDFCVDRFAFAWCVWRTAGSWRGHWDACRKTAYPMLSPTIRRTDPFFYTRHSGYRVFTSNLHPLLQVLITKPELLSRSPIVIFRGQQRRVWL